MQSIPPRAGSRGSVLVASAQPIYSAAEHPSASLVRIFLDQAPEWVPQYVPVTTRATALAITHIHTYLVHPGKGAAPSTQISGNTVPLAGKMFDILSDVYAKSEHECEIEIVFNKSSSGSQQNPCRDLILMYISGPTLIRGRRIAERLQ